MPRASSTTPVFETVTHRCRSKKRFSIVKDTTMMTFMTKLGRRLEREPRLLGQQSASGAKPYGVFLLPNSNVIEIYHEANGAAVGYLFPNLDVWTSYSNLQEIAKS